MIDIHLPTLSDEELLSYVYNQKEVPPPLVMELTARLEHALMELTRKPESLDSIVKDYEVGGNP